MEEQASKRQPFVRKPVCDEASILDSLGAGVLSMRVDGTILRANAGAERILRRPARELEGKLVDAVIAPLARLESAALEPVTGRHELAVQLGDGTVGSIGYGLSHFVATDGSERVVLQFQDIAPVLELYRQKDRLLAMAALGDALPSVLHELRNPLAAVTARLELMVEESTGELQADLHAVLAEVRRMGLGLDGVGGFVRSARASGNTAIDLAVEEACRVLSPVAERASVHLISRGCSLPLLPIDRGVISGLLFNLVKNSIDACRSGGTIEVTAFLEDGGQVFALRVEDNGCGMSEAVLARCTDLFFTNKEKGSGIGLALCKRVADSSGGSLEIQSEPQKGTVVTVRVPVTRKIQAKEGSHA